MFQSNQGAVVSIWRKKQYRVWNRTINDTSVKFRFHFRLFSRLHQLPKKKYHNFYRWTKEMHATDGQDSRAKHSFIRVAKTLSFVMKTKGMLRKQREETTFPPLV